MFPTDEILLGAPAYGRRKGTEGFVWHTTEAADASRTSAVNTATWQATPGNTTGSYNFIIYDGGILLTVPYLEASGGLATGVSPYWQPGRYPFLKAELSPSAYADPNAYLLNVAFSGKTAVFRDKGIPANMIETAQKLTAWAALTFGRHMVHSGHLHWQTNRSDPSTRVLALITGDDMAVPTRPVRQQWKIPAGTKFWLGGPELGEQKFFGADISLWSNGETLDGLWRRIEYHNTATEGEDLWVRRYDMTPIANTRNPATGFGPITTSGFTQADLDAAKADGIKVGKADIHAKAIVAAENNLTTVRGIK